MDNTIIDTEYLAFEAAVPIANRILASKGISETYSAEKLMGYWFGMTFKDMVKFMGEKHNFTITPDDLKEWKKWEEDAIVATVTEKGEPCKGVVPVIEKILSDGFYKLAIVSSSSLTRMHGCLDGTNMRKYFNDEYIFSANSSLLVPTPKPESDIYEFALEKLGITAEEAIAVEDSRGGAISAIGAGIDVIGYLGCINMPVQQAQLANDFSKEGATGIMWKWDQFFEILHRIENGE